MPAQIFATQIDARNRLDEIGFTVEELLEVVSAAVAARNSCTENNPSSAPGWYAWSEGSRRLREIALPKDGWLRDESNGVPSIVHLERGIKIAVCNTDDGTCLIGNGRLPQNRTKKGSATDRIANENQALLFPDEEIPTFRPIGRSHVRTVPGGTFYLCIFHERDDVRAELSAPCAMDGGFFAAFSERIFLTSPDGDWMDWANNGPDNDAVDSDEFDIPVIRKK